MRGIRIVTRKMRDLLDDPLLVGHVVKSTNNNELKTVKVLKMELEKRFNMYFNKSIELSCTDKSNLCKLGDIVLIKRNEPLVTPFEAYKISEVIFKAGLTIDPITNEKINRTTLEAC